MVDLNRDGKQDLVVVNGSIGTTVGHTVTVLLGNGDGSFRAPVSYAVGSSPYAVVAADFNRDGIPDLAVANGDDDNVSILFGNGDGTFAGAMKYAAHDYPDGLAVGDFNGDGMLDLAVVNDYSDDVSILLGHGDGTFGAATHFAIGSGPAGVAVADLNGDGLADLAVANRFDGTMAILLGNGDGTFLGPLIYDTDGQLESIAAGDLNGDGKIDLVITDVKNSEVWVWMQPSQLPATLVLKGGSPQTTMAGTPFATALSVLARDSLGQPLPGVSIMFVAPATGASGAFGASANVAHAATDSAGVAVAPAFVANSTVGTYSVIASVGTLNASFSLTNTANSSLPLAFTSGPPLNGTYNVPYTFTCSATGTPTPTFSVLSNALPPGLLLNGTTCLINGTPNAGGTFAGVLKASNGVAPDATQAFAITIAPLGQTIAFNPIADQSLDAAPFPVTATASSGLAVAFLSLTSNVCAINNNIVTLVAGGTCTIRAGQGGNANYAPAPNVDRTFQVKVAAVLALTPDSASLNVSGDEVSIAGAIQAPPNSGLLVNGVAALIDESGRYYLDHVPVAAGENAVTLTLTTLTGQTVTQMVQVNATGSPTPIVFTATPSIGVVPLATSFSVKNQTGYAVTKVEFDRLGNGNYVDVTSFNGRFDANYGTAGNYHPSLRVTDDSQNVHVVSTVVVSQDGARLDQMLQDLWKGLSATLISGDLVSATRYLDDSAVSIYQPVFATLNGSFSDIIASFGSFSATTIADSFAEYAVTRTSNGSKQVFLIYFVRGNDGIWRVDSM